MPTDPIKVDILHNEIVIRDQQDRVIVVWGSEDWEDDPAVVQTIVTALQIGYEQGAAALQKQVDEMVDEMTEEFPTLYRDNVDISEAIREDLIMSSGQPLCPLPNQPTPVIDQSPVARCGLSATESINHVQALQFELMKAASFNSFDGEAIVKSLLAHRELWTAAVMTRFRDIIYLRDMPDNLWNVDTL